LQHFDIAPIWDYTGFLWWEWEIKPDAALAEQQTRSGLQKQNTPRIFPEVFIIINYFFKVTDGFNYCVKKQ